MKRLLGTVIIVITAACGGSAAEPTADTPEAEAESAAESGPESDSEPATASDSEPATASDSEPATGSATVSADPGPGPTGVSEGRWTVAFNRVTPEVLACTVATGPDGTTVDVAARGTVAGGRPVDVRVVDSPPSDGRSTLSIDLPDDGIAYIADVAPTGAAFVEIDDLFWEINEGWFYLLGSFPTADGDIDIDLEIACTGLDGTPIDTDTGIDVGTAAGVVPDPPCATLPDSDITNGYPAANLPFVEERLDFLVANYEGVDGRFCVTDGGDIWYYLVFDFPADGFHGLDVCGTIFNYFEGDFEHAALAYTDETSFCG